MFVRVFERQKGLTETGGAADGGGPDVDFFLRHSNLDKAVQIGQLSDSCFVYKLSRSRSLH